MAKAQSIGHGDAAAVGVECALRIDLQVFLPVEARTAVADGKAKAAVGALERYFRPFRRVFRLCEPALHFVAPSATGKEARLFFVGDAEVPVLDGVDEELRQADHGGIGIGACVRQKRAEVASLINGLKCEDSLFQQAKAVESLLDL